MAINKINSKSIEDLQISADDLANGTISLDKLSATGTKDANTFLRGDGTFASAGSPSIDDNGDATAITIDSSENVGINTTSPQRYLHITGNDGASGTTAGNSDSQLFIDNAGSNGAMIEFGASNTGAGRIMFSDVDATNNGKIEYYHSSDHMQFSTANTERMRIDSSGHAIIPAGVTLGTSAGTYNAANTLDDYEEGTWEVDFTISGSSIGSFNNRSAYYTKIGNVVYVNASTQYTGSSLSGSYIVGGGLPFTISSQNKTGVAGTYNLAPGSGSTAQSVGTAGGWNEQDDFFMVPGGEGGDRYLNKWSQNYYMNVAFWYYTDA